MLILKNPATEQVLAELQEDTAQTIQQKAQAARAAQPAWAQRALAERIDILRGFKDLVRANQDRLATTLSSEMGKPVTQANNELNALGGRIDFFLNHVEGELNGEVVWDHSGMQERVAWEPLGVVANISAWNYPYFVGSNVFVPALLTGNAVLFKPSELTALTGQAIAELLWQAGVPKEIFALVQGGGAVGAELLKQPVDGVFFTGSYATGKRIAEAVAGRMIKVQLELGGKDPTYVCDDADPKSAAESLSDGAMYNAGQSCCSVERIYVHEAIAGPFIEAFVECVKGFKVGDPTQKETYMGPLARQQQLDVLQQQVQDAVAKGAKVLVGGKRRPGPGYYFEPTVLVDVTNDMALMREESFGPIIGIQVVKSDAQAVALMNDTSYGLTAGVYSQSKARAEALMKQLDAGTVYWNCCDRVSPRLPWTGRKGSGMGSTLSRLGIKAFVQPKAYHLRGPA